MFHKLQKLQIIFILAGVPLISCQSGANNTTPVPAPSPTPTPSPTPAPVVNSLQEFFNLLDYESSPPSLTESFPRQMTMAFSQNTSLTRLDVSFYQLSQCAVYLTQYSISGNVSPNSGYYTTSNSASYLLCSQFNFQGQGCAAQSAWTASIKFEFYNFTTKVAESCISASSDQSKTLGQIADYINLYYSRQCNPDGNCGFSDNFRLNIN